MIDFLASQNSFFLALILLAIGAIGSLLLKNDNEAANWWGNGFAILGSFLAGAFGVNALFFGTFSKFVFETSFPGLTLSLNFDALSAFFVAVIGFIAVAASVYAIGYVRHYYGKYSIGILGFFYNLFLLGMFLVVTSENLLFFLIAWEIMSLTSYFLVVYERNEESSIKAGSLYFIMTHIGTAFILFAFLLLYRATGSFELSIIRENIASLSAGSANLVFIFALIGFGTKAGIIPFHIWLPSAHPAAPSHVSALMSGVMIKTGIYMIARLAFDVLPAIPLWWGFVLLILGSVSALLGVLYALSEHDLKRLLAYHSIENIGIILLGLGSALVFLSYNLQSLALLGFAAALYHTVNHATFKALLFLGAGSVISETHTRNIEKYGGLIRLMPATALFFFIGAMAISALPPLNGFVSEWVTFQALFAGLTAGAMTTKIIFILAAGSLAFTGGLAAACFVKAFGATFLARPRSEAVAHAKESSASLLLGMGILTAGIVGLSFFASSLLRMFGAIGGTLQSFRGFDSLISGNLNLITVGNFASLSMPAIFAGIGMSIALVAIVISFVSRNQKVVRGSTWSCGTDLTPRMEITATAFSRSIITVFKGILRPSHQTEIEYHDASLRYFPKTSTFTLETHDVNQTLFYKPIRKIVEKISEQIRKIQGGNINVYILYIFLTLVVLLSIL